MELPKKDASETELTGLKPNYIEIKLEKKEKHFGAAFFLTLFLLFLAGIAFSSGWYISQVKERFLRPSKIENIKNASNSAQQKGWKLHEDKDNQFSLYYPPDWNLEPHIKGQTPGAKISQETSSVEFWLTIDQPIDLNEEQRAGLKNSETKQVEISGKKATVTTHEYQAGNFISVIVLTASDTHPQVTFWSYAADKDIKKITDEMIASFSF